MCVFGNEILLHSRLKFAFVLEYPPIVTHTQPHTETRKENMTKMPEI